MTLGLDCVRGERNPAKGDAVLTKGGFPEYNLSA